MPLYIIIFVAQVLCAVHVVRSGRPYYWIYLIIFVPLLGMAIYLAAEVLPEFFGGYRSQKAASQVVKALNPGRAIRDAERRLAITPTADNQASLAEAYLDAGRLDEAIELFRQALTGIHATDPGIMLGLARAFFASDRFHDAQRVLEALREANPDYVSPEGHLLYARSLEAQGRIDEALDEYHALAPLYPGQEARYRYAMLLRQAGHESDAQQVLREICQAAEIAPRHARRMQRAWYAAAKRELAESR